MEAEAQYHQDGHRCFPPVQQLRKQLVSLRSLPKVASCSSLLSQLISALSWTNRLHTANTYKSLRKKLTTRVGILRRLAGSNWGAGARSLRIATLALIHSAAEYCAPVWSQSAHTHLIDNPINDALRLVTGYLHTTPTDNLFVLSGITPTELRRKRATLSFACRAQESGSLLDDRLTSLPYGRHRQLKSRHPFMSGALELLRDTNEQGTSAARWADHRWSIGWREGISRLHVFFDDVDALSPGMGLSRPAWDRLNRLRTGVGLFRSSMHKWGMASTASCECGEEKQTANHIIISCPIQRYPNGIRGLFTVNESLARWLSNTCPAI